VRFICSLDAEGKHAVSLTAALRGTPAIAGENGVGREEAPHGSTCRWRTRKGTIRAFT